MAAGAPHHHLVLVGLMGSGKSAVGARCAAQLDRALVDIDELVELNDGRSVAGIFQADGEAVFRDLERRAVADACASPEPLVIACGGGTVLDPENRRRLSAAGLVVWLRASPAVLARRLTVTGEQERRPLLRAQSTSGASDSSLREQLQRLEAERREAYVAAADAAIDTDDLDPDAVADAVVAEWTRCLA